METAKQGGEALVTAPRPPPGRLEPEALAGFYAAPDVLADRRAIQADTWPEGRRPVVTEPPADLVERLAGALAVPRPWQRVTGPEGLAYLKAQARRRLAPLDGPARGLLVSSAEAEARRWAALAVHAKGSR